MAKKVFYKGILIEGYQSFGKKLFFRLDRLGLNLVKGDNGAGKSTIFNALIWAEHGVNLKKSLETWEDRRPAGYQGVRVVVDRTDFEYDYRIARHFKYKGTTAGLKGGDKLMLFKKPVSEPKFTDAHLIGEGLHKSDMQELIYEQLGMDDKTYLNSIMFGQRVKSLIESPNADKRKLFEELFSLDFVEVAKDRAKHGYDELDTKVRNIDILTDKAVMRINSAEADLLKYEEIIRIFDSSKEERLRDTNERISEYESRYAAEEPKVALLEAELATYSTEARDNKKSELDKFTDDYKILNNDFKSVELAKGKLEQEISRSEASIIRLNNEYKNVATECRYCLSPLNADKVKTVKDNIKKSIKDEEAVLSNLEPKLQDISKESDRLSSEIDLVVGKVNSIKSEIAALDLNLKRVYEIPSEIKSVQNTLKMYRDRLSELRDNYTKIDSEEPPKVDLESYRDILKESKALVKHNGIARADLVKEMERTDWWIKKGFGSGGLKSYVFNAMLNQLNIYAQKYAGMLGFRVEFSVDMTMASKPFQTLIYEGDVVRDYEDLSGGQKQRVDVCIAFAMHDLVGHKADINILIMDEIFEGLDNAGVESAFALIRQKAETKSVYLITHSDIIDSLNAKTVVLDLDEDGNTQVIA